MKYRIALLTAALAIFVVGGTVYAATTRDITTRIGGKIGELFKINGSFWVTKNAKIDGKLTVGKLNVFGVKRYTGKIDTTLDGDFVSTLTYSYDCTLPAYATAPHTVATHYKALTVPEVKLATLPDIRVYYRTITPTANAILSPITSTYSPSNYPNGNDSWTSAGYYLTAGKIYAAYKTVSASCGGTAVTNYLTTGDYQVVIN
jgi:hypothetical protein